MRDVLALALVLAGCGWAAVTLDKAGLVVAFAGITLLPRGAIVVRDS